jgi:hypothetical protein
MMSRLCVTLCTILLIASDVSAQRAGSHGGGGGGTPRFSTPAFGRTGLDARRFSTNAFGRSGGFIPWAYPAFYGDYGYDNGFGDGYPTQPNVFVMMPAPQAPPEQPPPPPPPPTPVIREYHWPAQMDPPAAFSIVTTSGTEFHATMVWRVGDRLHFNSTEGGVREVPLSAVSRSLTQAANARKNLNLPLP